MPVYRSLTVPAVAVIVCPASQSFPRNVGVIFVVLPLALSYASLFVLVQSPSVLTWWPPLLVIILIAEFLSGECSALLPLWPYPSSSKTDAAPFLLLWRALALRYLVDEAGYPSPAGTLKCAVIGSATRSLYRREPMIDV